MSGPCCNLCQYQHWVSLGLGLFDTGLEPFGSKDKVYLVVCQTAWYMLSCSPGDLVREQCVGKGELMTFGKFEESYFSVIGFFQGQVSNCPCPLIISFWAPFGSPVSQNDKEVILLSSLWCFLVLHIVYLLHHHHSLFWSINLNDG